MSAPVITLRSVAGLQTGICVVGEGKPVLALHGWGGSIQSFWPVAERLIGQGYQVHLLDLPGFGQSDLPPQPWGVGDYARFVVSYLDDSNLRQVSFLGHSFGGRIGLVLAADYPGRINKMVLADSAGIRTPLTAYQQVRSFLARSARRTLEQLGLEGWRDRLRDGYNRRYASEDYLAAGPLRETFVLVIEQDLTAYAERVQAPTVLIWGDQDADTPLWQGQRLEQIMPDAGLVVFKGAGHFAYLECLNDYVRIVDHFLNSGS